MLNRILFPGVWWFEGHSEQIYKWELWDHTSDRTQQFNSIVIHITEKHKLNFTLIKFNKAQGQPLSREICSEDDEKGHLTTFYLESAYVMIKMSFMWLHMLSYLF